MCFTRWEVDDHMIEMDITIKQNIHLHAQSTTPVTQRNAEIRTWWKNGVGRDSWPARLLGWHKLIQTDWGKAKNSVIAKDNNLEFDVSLNWHPRKTDLQTKLMWFLKDNDVSKITGIPDRVGKSNGGSRKSDWCGQRQMFKHMIKVYC